MHNLAVNLHSNINRHMAELFFFCMDKNSMDLVGRRKGKQKEEKQHGC
jgi:hypothetical protein